MIFFKLPSSLSKNILLSLSFLFVLFTVSCGESSSEQEETQLPTDTEITQAVQSQLEATAGVPADSIQVETKKAVTTLRGSVPNLLAKQKASEVTQRIRGVVSVVNNLHISASRSDEAVQEDIADALAADPATESYEISMSVNNGMVTLKGAVESWQQKQLASYVASGVKGVKGITNLIVFNYEEVRDTAAVINEVQQLLQYNGRIDADQINVGVDKQTVILSGAVGSAAEKNMAIETAYVTGIENVNAEDLQVQPEMGSAMVSNEAADTLDAADIEQAIVRAFRYDPRVPADSLEVSVEDSVATLRGRVAYLNSKLAAARDALNTTGIGSVTDSIEVVRSVVVTPEIAASDEEIRSRIENSILRDPYAEMNDITVKVEKGFVVLSGSVQDAFLKDHIEQIASNIHGVISIDNQLEVQSGTQENSM